MSEHADVRKEVAEFYGKAVSRPSQGCCGGPAEKGATAAPAGYSEEDLATAPEDAAATSFGCGNPLAFSAVAPGEVVLDLGSGAGLDLLIAAAKVGPEGRVIGVDMTDEMIAKARANIAAKGLGNVEVRKGLIEELPVESASVDWVVSNCVINLSPDRPRVFAEIARVLKPGGRISVSDIVVEDLPRWMRGNKRLYVGCVAGAISEAAYLDGLRAAGLVDVEVHERHRFDAAQVRAVIREEAPEAEDADGCCGAVEGIAGKVWSVRFYARKPPP